MELEFKSDILKITFVTTLKKKWTIQKRNLRSESEGQGVSAYVVKLLMKGGSKCLKIQST